MKIRIGHEFAGKYHYDSIVGKEATVLPWSDPSWDVEDDIYQKEICLFVNVGISGYNNWYIRKEDAIGFAEENSSYIALLKGEL